MDLNLYSARGYYVQSVILCFPCNIMYLPYHAHENEIHIHTFNKKLRERNGKFDEKLEGALGEVENWDIHDIDLEIIRMKNALEE